MSVLYNLIYRFSTILIRIQAWYFVDSNKWLYSLKGKRPRTANTILKNKVVRLTLPNFKIYHAVSVIKTIWYWWKKRKSISMEQSEEPEIYSHKYNQLIFIKGAKAIQQRKDSLSNKMCWKNRHPHSRNLDSDLTPFTKWKQNGSRV